MTKKETKAKKPKSSIRIRMYRVGFGDCFLLSLPQIDGTYKHFVIDCGVHGQGNINTIEDAVDDIAKETDKKLAAVIATHSHQDHISGFSDKFTEFEIGEVWLPWAEDLNDKLAKKWNKKQAELLARLQSHFQAQAILNTPEAKTRDRRSALSAVENLVANKKAMSLLRGGFNVGANVRYMSAGKILEDAAGVKGLQISVLGPPREEKFLAKMDPPADQRWLKASPNGKVQKINETLPFAAKWLMKYQNNPPLSNAEKKAIQKELRDSSLDSLAFALDNAKNNTSLVTLFSYRGQHLLFPGDAQYGNWQSWIEKDDADAILESITFLKVGHHGSHNATPKEIVSKLTSGSLSAMVSTQSIPWDSIPKVPLMEQLYRQSKKRVVRSDWIDIKGAPPPSEGSAPSRPTNLPSGFRQGAFWYDLEIPI
jgi:beta-lactamase superfamily II metal-dependent hydrolase